MVVLVVVVVVVLVVVLVVVADNVKIGIVVWATTVLVISNKLIIENMKKHFIFSD